MAWSDLPYTDDPLDMRGTHALFVGLSGTSKTMAAGTLATAPVMHVYRVDLVAVVS